MFSQIGGLLSAKNSSTFDPCVVFVTAESWTVTYS